MHRTYRGSNDGDVADEIRGSGVPGKRTLTQGIPARARPATDPPASEPAPSAASAPAAQAQGADPFDFSFPPLGLSAAHRAWLEPAFAMDLSDVRVHADSASATAMGAEAFARGNEIHFAPGRYDANGGDRRLLAHEVAHVAQQAEGRVAPTVQAFGADINDTPHLEHEADRMADDAVAGRATRTGPRLSPITTGVAQGYFRYSGRMATAKEVAAVRRALEKHGASAGNLKTFDTRAASPIDEGLLSGISPMSIAQAVRDYEAEQGGGDSGDESDSSDRSASPPRKSTLERYDSEAIPEGSSSEDEEILRNKGDKKQRKISHRSMHSAQLTLASHIRDFRAQPGKLKNDPDTYPPMVAHMGSTLFLVEPNPVRKDGAISPLVRTNSGDHLERDGKVRTNDALAKALDAHTKRLKRSYPQMNACLQHLRVHNDAGLDDLPHKIDADCLADMRELVAIWATDEARSSRAYELIFLEAISSDGTFVQRLGGKNPTYRGAPLGGSAALQAYTQEQKDAEMGGDSDSSTGM